MRIGEFVKQSVVDWPGEIAAVIFIKGCNFKCSYCHNHLMVHKDLLNRTPDLPKEVILYYLRRYKSNLTGVVITGGEPTLQADLLSFLSEIKALGLKIKLKTNGTKPEMLQNIIDAKLVDHISMDVKSGFSEGQYELIAGVNCDVHIKNVLESVSIIKASDISHQFFTVVLPGIHTPEILDEIDNMLDGSAHIMQKFLIGNESKIISCLTNNKSFQQYPI